jgi:type IV pilus assembly protein PilN
MRVSINLATRPFTDLGPIIKRLRVAMVAFAVVSIGLGVGLRLMHHRAEEARARDHSLDGRISSVTRERQGYETMMRQPDNAQVLDQAMNLNQLFDQKAFSWTLAMEDLETVLPGGVQVTTLEPIRDKQGRITLRLRVVGPRDKNVDLLQNLEHSRHFVRPTIVNESSENSGGPGERLEPVSASNKVNFDLLAEYNPAVVHEPAPKKPEVTRKASESGKATSATGLAHKGMGPAGAGPGLRRPPFAGVSHPQPAGIQPSAPALPRPPASHPATTPKPRAGDPQ